MRPVYLSDLHVAACALRDVPAANQRSAMVVAISHARIADRYRKRLRKAHPLYGPGTLAGVFGAVSEPQTCDAAYLAAMAVVVDVLRHC